MSMLKYGAGLVLLVLFSKCASTNHLADVKTSNIRITPVAGDTILQNLIQPYRSEYNVKMNEIIAENSEIMVKDRPESLLTNWVADALYHQAKKLYDQDIALAYQNYGGIRIPSLGKGAIDIGKMYELMPFDNLLVVLELDGNDLLKFLNYIAEVDGAPISSTVKLVIKNKKIESALLHDKPIESNDRYLVALPDYIANGGDNLDFLVKAKRIDKNIMIRDLLINEAREQKVLNSTLDGRIKKID